MLYDLKTLHLQKAAGIDQVPFFSWKIQSREKNIQQLFYQLEVYSEKNLVWDSGKVQDSSSAFINYNGEPLESRLLYTWKVTVWLNNNQKETASGVFEMALLNTADWKAKWVASTFPRIPTLQTAFGNSYTPILFDREFHISKKIRKTRLYATSYGVYHLKMNDICPDDRVFAPEFTVYNKIHYYQIYDVKHLIHMGINHLSLYVGDGWYFNDHTGPVIKNIEKPSILYQLEITYEDDTTEIIASDGSERCKENDILYSDIFQGEKQDLRRQNNSIQEQFKTAEVLELSLENLRAQPMPPVRCMKSIPACEVFQSPKGEWIVDFGQVLCGRARILIDVPEGTEIVFEYFEVLDKDRNYLNTMFVPQKDIVISNGKKQLYEASFTFHGFRFIKISGLAEPKKEDFTAVLLTTEKENAASFECSDQRLNRLYQNVRWSQWNNMMSIPTDCPSREKAGWTGDILIYAKTALMNENVTPFLSSWLHNVIADQQPDGVTMITTPFTTLYSNLMKGTCAGFGDNTLTGVAGWSDAIVWVPYEMYQVTGNTRILTDTFENMCNWADYVIKTARDNRGNQGFAEEYDQYLWNTGFHFGEWLIPSQRHVSGFEICKESAYYITPFFGYKTISLVGEISKILGRSEQHTYYSEIAQKMKKAISSTLIEENRLPDDLMGAYVLAIAFELVPESKMEYYRNKLISLIEKNDNCLNTGFLATPFLLDALDIIGETTRALDILWQNKMPSWLYEVEHDATCIWEAWDADEARQSPRVVSFDHYAFGCVDDWITRRICGIHTDTPGYKHLIINPLYDSRMQYCKRYFESENGPVHVAWDKESLNVVIPCNSTATVIWNGEEYEIGSGEYTWKK